MDKKVIILANNSNGLYVFRKDLICALQKTYDVVCSTPRNSRYEDLRNIGCKMVETDIDRRGMNPVKDAGLLGFYLKILKNEKPDLVITYTIKPNIYGGIVCRIMRIPYAVNITGLGSTFQSYSFLRWMVSQMYKIALKKAKVIFFENVENRNIMIEEGIIKETQACLLNGAGVNLEYFSPAEYPEDNEVIRFIFVGRVMKEKGIEELLEATRRLWKEDNRVVLDILGSYEEDFQQKIKKCEEEGWLFYYGHQSDVRPFVQKAHCFVLPSWHEGMANTNLECAAMERPIITSNIHGCKEAVIENVSGFLCEKQNTESLYFAMKKMLNISNEERKNMGIAGRKHMEDMFDKKKVVAETIRHL